MVSRLGEIQITSETKAENKNLPINTKFSKTDRFNLIQLKKGSVQAIST